MKIRLLEDHDRAWAKRLVSEHFGSARVVSRGILHETFLLPGLVAEDETMPIGFLQYHIEQDQYEVVILISIRKREGIGTTLLQALRPIAEAARCRRILLVTTNNNRISQFFYQAIGFRQCAIYPNAVAESRMLKPEIPEYDENSIAIQDAIEFEWTLTDR